MTSRPFLILFLLLALPGALECQVIPDSIARPPDSLGVQEGDTIPGQETPGDSINPADTLPAVEMPGMARPLPAGWHTGVWEWDRDGILGSKALTLAELVSEITGAVPLRGGDFGSPTAVSAFGAGGGRIRVFRDGIEILPLEGSVADLSLIGLSGLRSVRVTRSTGELRIEMESLLTEGGRPYSLVEAGTGDLNTNVFRGTFSHPRAFGGAFALAMDRVDTQGAPGQEPGSSSGFSMRYARPVFGRGVVAGGLSRMSEDRGAPYEPPSAGRSDWHLRTRWTLAPGLVADLFYASSSLKRSEETDTFDFGVESRTQLGAGLSLDIGRVAALGSLKRMTGEGIPKATAGLELMGDLAPVGGISGELAWESWEGRSVSRTRFRAWTVPRYGLSLFAERGSGEWGLPYLPDRPPAEPDTTEVGGEDPPPQDTIPVPPAIPGPRFSSLSATRLGAQFQWRGFSLAGARLSVEADSLFPLGLPSDRDGEALPGGKRNGFEISGRIPLYPRGMALVGSYQWWDQPEEVWVTVEDSLGTREELLPDEELPWRYLPRRNYQGGLAFHNTYLPTGNLEVWFDLGVHGRDPMVMPFREEVDGAMAPATVPFYQSWFVRLQIRIVTVRAFFMWENFTIRQRNQDFPGRLLPGTRSIYGVRWTMRN